VKYNCGKSKLSLEFVRRYHKNKKIKLKKIGWHVFSMHNIGGLLENGDRKTFFGVYLKNNNSNRKTYNRKGVQNNILHKKSSHHCFVKATVERQNQKKTAKRTNLQAGKTKTMQFCSIIEVIFH
jgi:hypothetical protein